ncbi:hypothetical protein JW935_18985 [candidate division KSB1 bacterium]|nr:hypothetical protein [candidate division KSB1 bacterium]
MNFAIFIVFSILFGLLLMILIIRSVASGIKKYAQEKLRGKTIIKEAPFARMIGQKSKGMWQVRGNGYLALATDTVYFFLAAPRREINIPLRNISQITFPTAFMGKTVFKKLLCISFSTPQGEDAVAWQVADPDIWKQEIERIAKKKLD